MPACSLETCLLLASPPTTQLTRNPASPYSLPLQALSLICYSYSLHSIDVGHVIQNRQNQHTPQHQQLHTCLLYLTPNDAGQIRPRPWRLRHILRLRSIRQHLRSLALPGIRMSGLQHRRRQRVHFSSASCDLHHHKHHFRPLPNHRDATSNDVGRIAGDHEHHQCGDFD
jgi:hypothetical protein